MRYLLSSVLALSCAALPAQTFTHFEAPQTHAAAVSAAGDRLYTVDTADARLLVHSLRDPVRPVLLREIRVGLGPVAVRPRSDDEVWVVNFVSDSISVVSVARGEVIATIQTEDEPGDVVFAGTPALAFVPCGTARCVEVYDPVTRALVDSIEVFGDDPRSIEVSADGSKVWVAAHRSGNGTTLVPDAVAPPPPPPTNPALPAAPAQGIIVRADDPRWSGVHGVTLPDLDVFEIDTATRTVTRSFAGVGTILFDVARRPGSDELWVANTEALNLVRFEPALRGHFADNRITRIDLAAGVVTPVDLNPGIDYSRLPNASALGTALAQPTDTVFAPSGEEAYVAAFGTDRIGVLAPDGSVRARIEVGTATGASVDPATKRGPRALAHHPTRPLLYVVNRIANTVAVVDTRARAVVAELTRPDDRTPAVLRAGRGFLYDAKLSGNGTASCATCHVDGTTDNLSWDLGDPAGAMETAIDRLGQRFQVHPMKGPMLTQTLQGLQGTQPFHWRGDRARLQDFNPTFDKLMGGSQIAAADMDAFAAFMQSIRYMPNPHLGLDRALPAEAAAGRTLFTSVEFRPGVRCIDCHSLVTGSNSVIFSGPVLETPQPFETGQLRNLYKRTGMTPRPGGATAGFGVSHDGHDDSVFDFLGRPVFGPLSTNVTNRRRLEAFVLAFDNGTAPLVGHQRTLDAVTVADPDERAALQTMLGRARLRDGDVVVHARIDGEPRGFAYDAFGQRFAPDRAGAPFVSLADLETLARGGAALTFTGVWPGDGRRLGIDRDLDGVLDGDEAPRAYGVATPTACATPVELAGNAPSAIDAPGFAFVVAGGQPARPGALMVGFAATALRFAGLEFLVDPAGGFTVGFPTDARGEAALPLPLANDPALVGATLFLQAATPSACAASGVQLSRGLQVTVQPR